MKYVFNFFCGRHTFFALFFAVIGSYLAYEGKLTATYVSLAGAVQALAFAHSVKEDMLTSKINQPK